MRDAVIFSIVAMVVLSFTIGGGSFGPLTEQSCTIVEGEVIAKDHSDGLFKLYAIVRDGTGQQNYVVYVGPTAYDSYNVGDIYSERMCELDKITQFKDLISDLVEMGIVEELNN